MGFWGVKKSGWQRIFLTDLTDGFFGGAMGFGWQRMWKGRVRMGCWWGDGVGLAGDAMAPTRLKKKQSINPFHPPTNHPLHPLQHPLLTNFFAPPWRLEKPGFC